MCDVAGASSVGGRLRWTCLEGNVLSRKEVGSIMIIFDLLKKKGLPRVLGKDRLRGKKLHGYLLGGTIS